MYSHNLKIPFPSLYMVHTLNRHVKAKAKQTTLPSSVSCHTMPSKFTLVPGSQGPRHSGSVSIPTSQVLTPTERVRTKSCSTGAAILDADGEK